MRAAVDDAWFRCNGFWESLSGQTFEDRFEDVVAFAPNRVLIRAFDFTFQIVDLSDPTGPRTMVSDPTLPRTPSDVRGRPESNGTGWLVAVDPIVMAPGLWRIGVDGSTEFRGNYALGARISNLRRGALAGNGDYFQIERRGRDDVIVRYTPAGDKDIVYTEEVDPTVRINGSALITGE